jgi:hypothetical protein
MKKMTKDCHDELLDSESMQDQAVFLEIENELLKEKLGFSAFCSYFAPDMDPLTLNQFLKHILFIEDIGPQITIGSLFPPNFTFPPLEEMSETELITKIEFIVAILTDTGIVLELSPDLPPDLTYKYIVEEMLPEVVHCNIPERSAIHFTGCGGWCPECFQKDYCEMKKELWPDL